MRLAALVTERVRRELAGDPWLASLDWHFLPNVAALPGVAPDLLIIESECLPAPWPEQGFGCLCWAFGVSGANRHASETTEIFRAPLDIRVLADRLLAWMWVADRLTPACFAGLDLSLANGRLSFTSTGRSLCPMQMTVRPFAGIGGDVALYYQDRSRILVVLADAIGHGEEAALDAAQFVLAVVRHIVPVSLSLPSLGRLCDSLSHQLTNGRFVAAALLDMDLRHGRAALVNAGMPDVLRLRHGEPEAFFPSRQPPLGLAGCPEATVLTMPLEADTQWVFCSDGVDGTALRAALKSLRAHEPDSILGLEALLTESGVPLHLCCDIEDDASQIILCIPA
jgi:hypothetical protein